MSAALKVAIIVTALCALCSADTQVSNEKEKRDTKAEPATSQVIPQQLKRQTASQLTYQPVHSQVSSKQSAPSKQYSPQQLQYIYQHAVLPQLQKQAFPSPLLSQQYIIPQQQQIQYLPVAQPTQTVQHQLQQKGAAAPIAGHAEAQLQAQLPQALLGGQYYFQPSQFATVLGPQYQNPGPVAAPYYFVPQHQAQQFYQPQAHHAAAATASPAFYFGGAGFQGNYHPFLGNQQFTYFPQNQPQQIVSHNVKGISGVEAKGKDAYVLPAYDGVLQLQQYSTLPTESIRAGPAVQTPQLHAQLQTQQLQTQQVQTQQREAPALSGKYGSKTNQ